MLTQLYYADFTQIIYAIHYAFYAVRVITQIIYADFTQIIYAIHYAVYAIHLRRHIYAITIISLRRLRKYRFHYASLRKGQLADETGTQFFPNFKLTFYGFHLEGWDVLYSSFECYIAIFISYIAN